MTTTPTSLPRRGFPVGSMWRVVVAGFVAAVVYGSGWAAIASVAVPRRTASMALPNAPGSVRCTTPTNVMWPEVPWAQQRLAGQRAWDLTRGEGITVAVIDTGVDGSVPQLS